jgi:hypothetical protein
MAEREGFEPSVRVYPGQLLSRQPCSATPAPLRRSDRSPHSRGGSARSQRGLSDPGRTDKLDPPAGVFLGGRRRAPANGRDHWAGHRQGRDQHDPLPLGRHGGEGAVGTSGRAAGAGAARLSALDTAHAPQPGEPRLAEPRPFRAVLRPRLGSPLFAAPPGGLWHSHGGAAALQPRGVRPLRLPHLGDRQRRRPDGGGLARGHLARGSPAPLPAQGLLRRQRGLHRRLHPSRLLGRLGEALRVLRLARAPRGRRQRSGGPGKSHRRGGSGDRAPHSRRGPHRDRLRQPEQGGHGRGARLSAGRRRGEADQAGPGLAHRADLPGAGRGARRLRRGPRTRPEAGRGMERPAPALPRGSPRGCRRPGAPPRRQAAGRLGRRPAEVRARRQGHRDPRGFRTGDQRHRRQAPRAGRRLGRPGAVEQHADQGGERLLRHQPGRTQPPLRRPRARHGLDLERHGPVPPVDPLRRHVPDLLGLHAAADPPRCAPSRT